MSGFASRQPEPAIRDSLDDGPLAHVPIQQSPARHAAEWGLASLLLGAMLAALALMTLQLCAQLFFGPPIWAREDLRNLFWASILAVLLVLGLTIASGTAGIVSLVSATRHGQPCALGMAGLLASVFALILWIFVFIDLFSVLDFLLRRQGHGGIL